MCPPIELATVELLDVNRAEALIIGRPHSRKSCDDVAHEMTSKSDNSEDRVNWCVDENNKSK